MKQTILSAYCGSAKHGQLVPGILDSGQMLARIAQIHFRIGARVADMTYGKGTFWTVLKDAVAAGKYTLAASDIRPSKPGVRAYDFRNLPYSNDSFDVVLLDPMWLINPQSLPGDFHDRFNMDRKEKTWEAVVHELYLRPLEEAYRILVPGGLCIIKTGDQVWHGSKIFGAFDVDQIARATGFERKDRFVQIAGTPPPSKAKGDEQVHGRSNFSDWLVYRVPKRPDPPLFTRDDALKGLPRPDRSAAARKAWETRRRGRRR